MTAKEIFEALVGDWERSGSWFDDDGDPYTVAWEHTEESDPRELREDACALFSAWYGEVAR